MNRTAPRRPLQLASYFCPWFRYVTQFSRETLRLTGLALDCLDLVLWLRTKGQAPQLHRFVCPPQGTARLNAPRKTNVTTLHWPPGNNTVRQSSTANVYVSTTQWLRDLVSSIWLSRRTRRSKRPQRFATALRWPNADVTFSSSNANHSSASGCWRAARTPRPEKRCTLANGVPVPRESHLLLRSQP